MTAPFVGSIVVLLLMVSGLILMARVTLSVLDIMERRKEVWRNIAEFKAEDQRLRREKQMAQFRAEEEERRRAKELAEENRRRASEEERRRLAEQRALLRAHPPAEPPEIMVAVLIVRDHQ